MIESSYVKKAMAFEEEMRSFACSSICVCVGVFS